MFIISVVEGAIVSGILLTSLPGTLFQTSLKNPPLGHDPGDTTIGSTTFTLTLVESAVLVMLLVAMAVYTLFPCSSGFKVSSKGGLLTSPIKLPLSKNSTFIIDPSASVALAINLTVEPLA